MEENVVFARVGWMQSYQASVTGEPGPIGGGKYNLKNLGWERDNFLFDATGRAYGYFAIGSGTQSIDLFRIGGRSLADSAQKISGVLVIFVAPHPIRKDLDGPLVVGWYRNATVYRDEQESTDGKRAYRVEAMATDVTLIPSVDRNTFIPHAKAGVPGIGQSNIYYTREGDGSKRALPWLKRLLAYVAEFRTDSGASPIVSAEIQAEQEAGFQSNPRIRKAVEDCAMKVVRSYYSRFTLKDTSKTHSYDYSYMDGGIERYIEVKGSQQANPSIILTRNEVTFAQQHSALMELCVVHSIIVKDGPIPIATGGVLVHFREWNPDKHQLAAMQYQCRLNATLASA